MQSKRLVFSLTLINEQSQYEKTNQTGKTARLAFE